MGWLSDKVAKAVSNGNPAAVKAVDAVSRAAMAADEARHGPTPPEGGYATFEGDEKPKRRWGR